VEGPGAITTLKKGGTIKTRRASSLTRHRVLARGRDYTTKRRLTTRHECGWRPNKKYRRESPNSSCKGGETSWKKKEGGLGQKTFSLKGGMPGKETFPLSPWSSHQGTFLQTYDRRRGKKVEFHSALSPISLMKNGRYNLRRRKKKSSICRRESLSRRKKWI